MLITRISISLLLCCSMLQHVSAQSCKTTASYINSIAALRDTMRVNPAKRLVALQSVAPTVKIALAYATPHNFTGTVLYTNAKAYLLRDPAIALAKVEQELNREGFGLKVFDAFRPFSVTCHLWDLVHDARYAANPITGSNHNRGLAVDLTIIDIKTGKELDMGTGFDNFSDTAHHYFMQLPVDVLVNRKVLKEIMKQHGFQSLSSEWWHYQWRTQEHFDIIDLNFDELSEALKE